MQNLNSDPLVNRSSLRYYIAPISPDFHECIITTDDAYHINIDTGLIYVLTPEGDWRTTVFFPREAPIARKIERIMGYA